MLEFSDNRALSLVPQPCDIIICIHNALEDVRTCINSVVAHTMPPYRLILIDDGSDAPTRDYVAECTSQHQALLLRNEHARGYTYAANQGLRASTAEIVVLLNSDTIVAPQWLQGLRCCAESDPLIGIVGPLSNTASWQSIPEIEHQGDWAHNPLPGDMSVSQMATRVAASSPRIYPRLPFLNGFCLLLKRAVIEQIGYFDEDNFGGGYGEENDYCIRARHNGWELAVADDVYIYHAQSKSYSHTRRQQLGAAAYKTLISKHGEHLVESGVRVCRHSRIMQGLRARARHLLEPWHWIEQGQYRWHGKKIIFLLPILEAGGGGNVVISEAQAMRKMGVDVRLINWERFREPFERTHPDLNLPVLYVAHENQVPDHCTDADAVIATANFTVDWLAPLAQNPNPPRLGYYIQDFEPYFYIEHLACRPWFWRSAWLRRRLCGYFFRKNPDFRRAWLSYQRIPQLIRFTKTHWNQRELQHHTGLESHVVGISYARDIFYLNSEPQTTPPIHISAMVRPSSGRRAALRTMQVLRKIQHHYKEHVSITLFGAWNNDPHFQALPRDFEYTNLELLNSRQVADLFHRSDIFADFSHFQAMGLTALEAMACGCAVIVPGTGGSTSFARARDNALVIANNHFDTCYHALTELIENTPLRTHISAQAAQDVLRYTPEKTALHILECLFHHTTMP
jgi:O-antigen biosynthesis protein